MEKRINVTRSSMPLLEEYIDEISDLWESHWLTNMGEKHNRLQQVLVDYLDVNNLELTVNGHMALEIAIQICGLKGEIITTPFTFVSTTHAIKRSGCTPVFCDIDPNDFCIDADKIESLITDRTCAIMPVHVYGNVCNVEKIQKIAQKYKLKVIYDAAHAFGVRYKEKGIASFGDLSCFSFHATKVFNTIEGGAICFDNSKYKTPICQYRDFGIVNEEEIDYVGTNAKMHEFSAAMGLCNIKHIDENIQKRKTVVAYYRDALSDVEGIRLNSVQDNVEQNYAYFPIVIEDSYGRTRDELYDILKTKGINARKYFYPTINSLACYRKEHEKNNTPIAQEISERILTLPLYADLCVNDVDYITQIILQLKR